MNDIFISYSRYDSDKVNELVTLLEQEGYSIWIDRDGIESGDDFKRVILKAIKESKVVLFFSSEHSNVSDWTAKEIGVAVKYKKHIIPILLDDSNFNETVEFDLINFDFVDYSKASTQVLMREKLFKALRNKLGKGSVKIDIGIANGHEYVDLGLPSGTLWAACNVGANKPEDYGDYFAWGEINTKSVYDWNTYKYTNGDYYKLTKYCDKRGYGNNGFTDALFELQTSDDPATANWGDGWNTPSKDQWDELLANTTCVWSTRNGVGGMSFTSKQNGQTLFLPAAGYRGNSILSFAGGDGYYWSSSLQSDYPDRAWYYHFDWTDCEYRSRMSVDARGYGQSVRPVRQN